MEGYGVEEGKQEGLRRVEEKVARRILLAEPARDDTCPCHEAAGRTAGALPGGLSEPTMPVGENSAVRQPRLGRLKGTTG